MKTRKYISGIVFSLIVATQITAFATPAGDAILAEMATEDKLYHAMMSMRVVQELMVLRDNFAAAQNYYQMAKDATSGKGVLYNTNGVLQNVAAQNMATIKQQFTQDWVTNSGAGSQLNTIVNNAETSVGSAVQAPVGHVIDSMSSYGAPKIKVAQDVTNASTQAKSAGELLFTAADKASRTNGVVAQTDLLKALALIVQTQAQTNILLAQLVDIQAHMAQIQMNGEASAIAQAAALHNVKITQ